MPAPQFVDLHTHTTASDGSDTPREVVRKAHACKLAAIAITDHDTLAGLDEAEEEGQRLGIEVIRGCEISVDSEYGEVHILGLWVPKAPKALLTCLEELREKRHTRNQRIVARLQAQGISITLEDIFATAKGESIGRPHIAQVLVAKGIVLSIAEAFQRYLGQNGTAYEPKDRISPEEGIRQFVDIGATVSLAHCMLIPCSKAHLESMLSYLASLGLSAIEAYHSGHTAKHERFCVGLAARHNLCLTGGSDYHGTPKPRVQLGRGKGNLRVTLALLDNLKAHRRAQGLPV